MAYDRYDPRESRDERSRWPDDRSAIATRDPRQRGIRDDRGFFERAGDEIASWFGDDEAERRRREDHMRDERDERVRGEPRTSDRGVFARGGDRSER